MFNLEDVSAQVLRNCDISDARHAGIFSICGLALRLRDLYKWQTGTPPWEEKDSTDVLEWIGRKEDYWDDLSEDEYAPITIDGRSYPPFETREINATLGAQGLYYGAGYGYSLKPTFFLARIEDKRRIQGIPVITLGRELARDLMTLPALSQDRRVLLRSEAARLYFWDQIQYVNRSGRGALELALDACGLADHRPESVKKHFDSLMKTHEDAFIYHEIGEIKDRVFDRGIWREIVAAFPHSPVELLARHVKDLLADTGPQGALARMIARRNTASLGFYAAFFDGLGREIFPELRNAVDAFKTTGDWQSIDAVREMGYRRARRVAEEMISIYKKGKQRNDQAWAAETIQSHLLERWAPKEGGK